MNRSCRARAHANIALIKYWGKSDTVRNLPAVPSLSLTLAALETTTSVRFSGQLHEDRVELNDTSAQGAERARVVQLLDRVREQAGISDRAEVVSENNFPTASGLASSASGFAALALAATKAAGLDLSQAALSALARQSSASAARSIYGGLVSLAAGSSCAEQILGAEDWPLSMLVVVTEQAKKETSSTSGMLRTQSTSPFYPAWVSHSHQLYEVAKAAISSRDFDALGHAMQKSTLMMHATMLTADPYLLYWSSTTLAVLERLRALSRSGYNPYFTMDAGPHVKVLCTPDQASSLCEELKTVPGVRQVLKSAIGPGVHLVAGAAP